MHFFYRLRFHTSLFPLLRKWFQCSERMAFGPHRNIYRLDICTTFYLLFNQIFLPPNRSFDWLLLIQHSSDHDTLQSWYYLLYNCSRVFGDRVWHPRPNFSLQHLQLNVKFLWCFLYHQRCSYNDLEQLNKYDQMVFIPS